MGRKSKIHETEKIAAIEKYLRGEDSMHHLAKILGVHPSTIKQWLQTYHSLGPGIFNNTSQTSYSAELKIHAVKDYLAGIGSLMEICKTYGIKSTYQLRNWIIKYNGRETLKTSGTGGIAIMTKGRVTTYDERVDIVKYCLEHESNYAQTAQEFQVSYQQVYSWTNKYLNDGISALQDRRGKRKSENEMSEVEKLKAQNKMLEAEIKRKQMEIDLLKKLDEIERRRF